MSDLNRQGRQTQPAAQDGSLCRGVNQESLSANNALVFEEPLIFELDTPGACGVDLPALSWPQLSSRLGLERKAPIGLPRVSEPRVLRHYVRLSQKNYSIDANIYPLGSCTMKHNTRLGEKLTRLKGFARLHPMAPMEHAQGAFKVMEMLGDWILRLTGMKAVTLTPKAGAHGELCALMVMQRAFKERGESRPVILVPQSAHGTNPASAAMAGFRVEVIPTNEEGYVDFDVLESRLSQDVAAMMLTNPNTCGVFERDVIRIADALHKVGAFLYCDGANFNGMMGKVLPSALGIDAMHLNLHKTFSTPHGGGGPGCGPVVFSQALESYVPVPFLRRTDKGFVLEEYNNDSEQAHHVGRMIAFHGQMGMFIRALAYMVSHGRDGLKQACEDAVLSANYILARLRPHMTTPQKTFCAHEALFDERFLKPLGLTTLDFAKAMIDEGIHPMTVYFPLVVQGALLIEPTESETRASLDEFIETMIHLVTSAKKGEKGRFLGAPYFAPRARFDETQAARFPQLRWRPVVR